MDVPVRTVSSEASATEEPRIDFLDELANLVRATHRRQWEQGASKAPGNSRSERDAYLEMTQGEVRRGVDELLATLEEQQTQSYYDAIELLDYEGSLIF
jgi:hypothetical protein